MNSRSAIIIRNLLMDPSYCPSEEHNEFPSPELIRLAVRNKVERSLSHLIVCTACKSKLSANSIRHIDMLKTQMHACQLLFEVERKRIDLVLKQLNSSAVVFKYHNQKQRIGYDMDILMRKTDQQAFSDTLKQHGYKKTEKVKHKEIQLRKPDSQYKLDVHHLIAYPMYGSPTESELKILNDVTRDILTAGASVRPGLRVLSKEWYVISQVIHFWHNDMFCSLSPLYEFGMFCHAVKNSIQWKRLFSLSDTYKCRNELIVILLLANNLLDIPVPTAIASQATVRLKLASYCISLIDIMFFPPVSLWYHRRYAKWVQKRLQLTSIIKMMTSPAIPVVRLIRPKILALVIRSLILK